MSNLTNHKIVMLGGKGESTKIVFNYLEKYIGIEKLIISDTVPTKAFLKRRMKRIGFRKVMGQVFFSTIVKPLLKKTSKDRIEEIIKSNGLETQLPSSDKILYTNSVNSQETIDQLKKINPDLVIVNGTAIISEKVLNCVPANFINMHAGITPMYRGSHGGYWALVNNDATNAGVTIHYVDKGVDTGNIIEQRRIQTTNKDNFVTYPYLQLVEGLKVYKAIIEAELNNELKTESTLHKPSKLWYNPTVTEYVWNRLAKKVK